MHPPFGFALFYLRSVAPLHDYIDKVTSKRIAPVTTGQIYWGAVPFVCIQIVMIGLVIAFPGIVTGSLDEKKVIDLDTIKIEIPASENQEIDPTKGFAVPAPDPGSAPSDDAPKKDEVEDPTQAILRSLGEDAKK
jgi:hypothetical protein